jgi:tRNA 2-thiouridine synthesizing protein C
MTKRSILLVLSTSPYRGARFAEALDALLVAAAFDQRCSVLLMDDAVYGLLPGQDGEPLGMRTPGRMLTALPDYEVERIYVCEESLAQRQLSGLVPVIPVERLPLAAQAGLIARHDIVWNG